MSTETNDGDIVRALKKQMDEMNLQMNAMMKINKKVMKDRGGGLGALSTTSVATASGRVDFPVPPVLPATDGFASPPPSYRPDEDLEQPGSERTTQCFERETIA